MADDDDRDCGTPTRRATFQIGAALGLCRSQAERLKQPMRRRRCSPGGDVRRQLAEDLI